MTKKSKSEKLIRIAPDPNSPALPYLVPNVWSVSSSVLFPISHSASSLISLYDPSSCFKDIFQPPIDPVPIPREASEDARKRHRRLMIISHLRHSKAVNRYKIACIIV